MTYIFDNISSKNKEKLLKLLEATTFTFRKNINILTSIKKENIIGVVESGRIQIIRNDYDGNRVIIEELSSNELFGSVISSISGDNYDIVTKEDDTVITVIDYGQIMHIESFKYDYFNQFMKNLMIIITDKIDEKNERIEILTQKTTRDKLLEYFRIISEKKGSKTFVLPFSFTELADYLAVDRSAMTREIKYLKEEGFIRITNKRVTMLY